jgi:hypothetical protein
MQKARGALAPAAPVVPASLMMVVVHILKSYTNYYYSYSNYGIRSTEIFEKLGWEKIETILK